MNSDLLWATPAALHRQPCFPDAVLVNFVLVCASVPLKGLHIVYSLFSKFQHCP